MHRMPCPAGLNGALPRKNKIAQFEISRFMSAEYFSTKAGLSLAHIS
jgi:hypothetical protein